MTTEDAQRLDVLASLLVMRFASELDRGEDPDDRAEEIIGLADDSPSLTFCSGDLSSDAYSYLFDVLVRRLVDDDAVGGTDDD